MRLYLRQLIDCIREARTEVTPPNLELWDSVDVNNEAEVEDISYVEEFIYGTPEPIFVITGILTDLLPLAGTLTNEEINKIQEEIRSETAKELNAIVR